MANAQKQEMKIVNGGQDVTINFQELRSAILTLKAIDHDIRQEIMNQLSETEEMSVSEIFIGLRMEQSVASQHLSVLRRSNLVSTRRAGKFVYYSLNKDRIARMAEMIRELRTR